MPKRISWKNAKEKVKVGRRTYGAIFELSDGREVYIARRIEKGLFRGGEKTDSDAVFKGTASWALDEDTLLMLGKRGIELVGVLWESRDQLYVTHITNFYDSTKFYFSDYSRRGGAAQRYLPLQHFRVLNRPAPVKMPRGTKRSPKAASL